MSALIEKSELYKNLSEQFEKSKGEITLEVYKNAINTAKQYEKEEVQFVLFSLKYVNSDVETGIGVANACINCAKNFLNTLTGKQYKLAFIYSVLEAAQSK